MNVVRESAVCGVCRDRCLKGRLAAFLAFAFASAGALADTIPACIYVQDGLVAQWDGIENAEGGVHDGSASAWRDCRCNASFDLLGGVTWTATGLSFPGAATAYGLLSLFDTQRTFGVCTNGTMETALATGTGGSLMMAVMGPKAGGQALGRLSDKIVFRSGISDTKKAGTVPATDWENAHGTYAALYTAAEPTGLFLNGVAAAFTPNAYDWWSAESAQAALGVYYPNRETANAAPYSGTLHSVRLYSRALVADEAAWNHAVDRARFFGDALSTAFSGVTFPDDVRLLSGGSSLEYRLSVSSSGSAGASACLAMDGGAPFASTNAWDRFGVTHALSATPPAGMRFSFWEMQGAVTVANPDAAATDVTVRGPGVVVAHFEATVGAAFRQQVDLYAQDGLVAFWDGVLNATNGAGEAVHDGLAATWRDLKGGAAFSFGGTVSWSSAGLVFEDAQPAWGELTEADTQSTFDLCKNGTLEVALAPDTGGASYALAVLGSATSGHALGYNTGRVVSRSGTVASGKSAGVFATTWDGRELTYAATYANGLPTAVAENGAAQTLSGNEWWSATASVGSIGVYYPNRSTATAYPFKGAFHALRLYSRALTADEIRFHAALDRVRFFGDLPSAALGDVLPDGARVTSDESGLEYRVSVTNLSGEAVLSLDGGETAFAGTNVWVRRGTALTVTVRTAPGRFIAWTEKMPAGAEIAPGGTSVAIASVTAPARIVTDAFTPTHVWTGAKSEVFSLAANWTNATADAAVAAPGAGDSVFIPAPEFGTRAVTVSSAFTTGVFRVGQANAATGAVTVTFNNGVATNVVSGNACLYRGATLTHTSGYTSSGSGDPWTKTYTVTKRLSLAVGGNFTIADGAEITTLGKGYANQAGPGCNVGYLAGGSYGGRAHRNYRSDPVCYGNVRAPLDYGSGGNAGGGGGSVNLVVTGTLTVNGSIRSNAQEAGEGCGAGGSVFLTVGTLLGTGVISANGRQVKRSGSGGRISIVEKVATTSQFAGTVDCLGYGHTESEGAWHIVSANGTVYRENARDAAGRGTLTVPRQTYPRGDCQTELAASRMPDANEPFGAVIVEAKAGLRLFAGTTCSVVRAFSVATAQGSTFTADVGSELRFVGAGDACVTGALTVAGLACEEPGKRILFTPGAAGKTTVKDGGYLLFRGTEEEPVELWGAGGAEWLLSKSVNAGCDVFHASVTNSNADSGGAMLAISSVDLGGNTKWSFQDPILPGAVITWTGNVNSDWATPGNWSPAREPVETDDVRIPSSGVSRFPVLNAAKLTLNKCRVDADASWTLNNGCTLTVTNDLTVAGSLTLGGPTVVTCLNSLNLSEATLHADEASVMRLTGGLSQAVRPGGLSYGRFEILKEGGDVTFDDGLAARTLDVKTTGPVTLAFAADKTVTAAEAFVRGCTNGTEGTLHPLVLKSASPGAAWKLATTDVQFFAWVDVQDSTAVGHPVWTDAESYNRGSNAGWLFGGRAVEWTGAASADFAVAGNWYPHDAAPDADTRVLVFARSGETKSATANAAASVSNLVVGAGWGKATVTCYKPLTVNGFLTVATNGTLSLNSPVTPNTVAKDATLLPGATLRHEALKSTITTMAQVDASGYRMLLDVGGNATIAKGATVTALDKGFYTGKGPLPGAQNSTSAGNASRVLSAAGYLAMTGYGSMFEPLAPGSGGGQGTGGGVIKIVAGGNLAVDGTVDAGASYMSNYGDASAGGSVWLSCGGTFSGAGKVNASGGYVSRRCAPGGGYVTVEYGTDNTFAGTLIAAGGCGKNAETTYPGPGIVLVRKRDDPNFAVTLDQTPDYVYGATLADKKKTPYASAANMANTLTDIPQRLDAHDLRRYRGMAVTCGMISAFNLTTNLTIRDLHFTAPTGSIVRLNGFRLTILSREHKNGKGWAVPNALTDPVAQHVVRGGTAEKPGIIEWKQGFALIVR